MMDGGGHERGMRSGTLNVPGIVGFGKSCELCGQEMETEAARLIALRTRLHEGLTSQLEDLYLNGHPTLRLPGNLNLSFSYVEGESFLMGLNKEIALSSGSACTSATLEPSYVLKALGVGEELAHTSIRFGLGRFNTEADVDYVVRCVVEVTRGYETCLLSMRWRKKGSTSSPCSGSMRRIVRRKREAEDERHLAPNT